jgi:hypothetical protein
MALPIEKKEDRSPPLLKEIDLEVQTGPLGRYEVQVIKGLKAPVLNFNDKGEILLSPLLTYLKSHHYSVAGAMVSFYSPSNDMYEFCGSEPLGVSASVCLSCLQTGALKLKCREPQRADYAQSTAANDDRGNKASRRTKERKIGFIIEKVARWRNLYNGISTGRGETVRMTLEEAALQVGISKKSLDDYLLQLRFGRRFGFNFQEHRHEKVGLLRTYVKQCKSLQTRLVKEAVNSEDLKELLSHNSTPVCRTKGCCSMSSLQV